MYVYSDKVTFRNSRREFPGFVEFVTCSILRERGYMAASARGLARVEWAA